MAWTDPSQSIIANPAERNIIISRLLFFSDPFFYLLHGIQRLAAYVDSRKVMHPLQIFYGIVVVLGVAYMWNPQKDNKLFFCQQLRTWRKISVATAVGQTTSFVKSRKAFTFLGHFSGSSGHFLNTTTPFKVERCNNI